MTYTENLRNLSDEKIQDDLKQLREGEKRTHVQILRHLLEVDRRKIFSKRGYPSLFEYCMKELGYSPGATSRRINSMRLLEAIPEIADKFKSGELTLSTASTLQSFFRTERKKKNHLSKNEKMKLVKRIERKTKNEAEKVLAAISPDFIRDDRERVITPDATEIRFTANSRLMKKLRRIKDLTAHKNPHPSYGELFEYLANEVLKKIDPEEKVKRAEKRNAMIKKKKKTVTSSTLHTAEPQRFCRAQKSRSRYIPSRIKHQVIKRDGWKCSYTDPETGKICGSSYGLEFEHLIPFAKGGSHSLENLTLRCREHNKLSAIREFGESRMNRFLTKRE